MTQQYDPAAVEAKWQSIWDEQQRYAAAEASNQPKYYVLEMFPYPSGRIHMGHVRNYSIGDVVARFKRMQGFNVLHPMGWDAFGMPAENAAIQNDVHPASWTRQNIDHMRDQLKRMGLSYDWQRELATCDADYYRWEQLVFLRMYAQGLAYKKSAAVNWCEHCQTVLANEQVEEGCCWRCGEQVQPKELEQWFFRTTAYAQELLEEIDNLTAGWPESVLTMQRNWIGRSTGCEIDFPLSDGDAQIRVFTTRPDTLYGATFMSLAPEHPWALELPTAQRLEAVQAFVERVKAQEKQQRIGAEGDKEGVFTGRYCRNPVTGTLMPIYIANFVLMEYGTGAVMAVPTHDQRDFEFAQAYGLDKIVVIQPQGEESLDAATMTQAYTEPGVLVNSGPFDGMKSEEAQEAIASYLQDQGLGRTTVNYRLRDWGVSRQRYWGTPIPIIYCPSCGVVPVPDEQLPVKLPEDVAFTGEGNPLNRCPEFYQVDCPNCGAAAKRETDTFDTFVESSWYFARYTCPQTQDAPLDRDKVNHWLLPVDQYIGGVEHAVMHLLYARFYTKVLRDLGFVDVNEPFSNLLTQGMVCKETQSCPQHGWLYPEEVQNGQCAHCGTPVVSGRIEKMSKSKKNVVDPEALIATYGADTARLFALFAAPPERSLEWNEQGVDGCYRFLQRLWRLLQAQLPVLGAAGDSSQEEQGRELRRRVHSTLKKVTADIDERFHFNTAIAAVMELVNYINSYENKQDCPATLREALETVVLMLSPYVPHIAAEMWQQLGHDSALDQQPWPQYDPEALVAEEVLLVLQVNGKVRGKLTVAADADEEQLRQIALENDNVKRFIGDKTVRKVIVVPGKLVNVVAK